MVKWLAEFLAGSSATWLAPLAMIFVAGLAEFVHQRRCRRVGRLAFGPGGRPRRWVAAVAPLRVLAIGASSWGLMTLLQIAASQDDLSITKESDPATLRHLVIALDVSPSMQLVDAGRDGSQSRASRARAVLRSVYERLDTRRTRVSVLAFYNDSRPVVVDTFDPEVVHNIIEDLPLEQAFTSGKTNMYSSIKVAAQIGKAWRPKTAMLLLVSDGDTLAATEPPRLPESFAATLVAGVGNAHRGIYIDAHSSRQNADALKQLAARLGGLYQDANIRHVGSDELNSVLALQSTDGTTRVELREYALAAVAFGSLVLALLGPALIAAGRAWNPRRARPLDVFARQPQPTM